MTFENFSVLDFPEASEAISALRGGFVYVVCWVAGEVEIPFYVGQTDGFPLRMKNYRKPYFSASTDFWVGEAIRYLRSTTSDRVIVRYRASISPPKEEKTIIRELALSGARLLNCVPRYDYRTASEAVEREAIRRFCDMFIEAHRSSVRS